MERALLTVLQLRSKMNKTSKIISQTKKKNRKKKRRKRSSNQRNQKMRLNLKARMRSSPITRIKMKTLMI